MLIKEKILNVLNEKKYSDLIKYKNRLELKRDLERYFQINNIQFEEHEITKLCNSVLSEGECIISNLESQNLKNMTLINYNSAIKLELYKTDLSNVEPCYKRRMLDILANRIYSGYDKVEVSIDMKNENDAYKIMKSKIDNLLLDNRNILKYAKSTLCKKEDEKNKYIFTIFRKRQIA